MVHLKTKEECRLSKETIQVWTVELPSKHAEGILKSVHNLVSPLRSHLADLLLELSKNMFPATTRSTFSTSAASPSRNSCQPTS
jgi:hypothetical protein